MASLNIALWNSGGLTATADSTPLKIDFFDKEFPNSQFDIVAFVETHHRDENDLPSYIAQCTFTSFIHRHHLTLHMPELLL